jgi:F-type H+-transporting ATPase subunit b
MSTKQFLIAFVGVYFVLWVIGTVAFGPPGYQEAYLEQYGEEHEHYIEVIKSTGYKYYVQNPDGIEAAYAENPNLAPPLANLPDAVAFVEQYESRDAFQAERTRRGRYALYFDFMNATALVLLTVWFTRKPLVAFLDEQVATVRTRIETAAAARSDADTRRKQAEERIAGLDQEREEVIAHARTLADQEAGHIREGTEAVLTQLDRESEQRRRMAEHEAAMAVKRELVQKAVARLTEQLKSEASDTRQDQLVHEFAKSLETAGGSRHA